MSTLFNPINTANINVYFPDDNSLQKAIHVFIEGNRLTGRWQDLSNDDARFIIGETGFGTGLNFLLVWAHWERFAPLNARLHFISCEQCPLSLIDLQQCLAIWPELSPYADRLLAAYPVLTPGFHQLEFEDGRVTLQLMLGDPLTCYQERLLCGDANLEPALRRDFIDAWFMNDLSLEKKSEKWRNELCVTMAQLSKQGTTFSMCSAFEAFQQGLCSAGFIVSKQTGYEQNQEILIAQWHQLPSRVIKRKTPWHVSSRLCADNKQAIVVGAGLAGCCVAYSLARRGWRVSVLDRQSTVGQGASGNHRAILFPMVSAYRAPLTELMLMGFLYASRFYQQCIKQWSIGDFSGILQLTGAEKKPQAQADLAKWLIAYPELGCLVDPQLASAVSGVDCYSSGILIPNTGWINSPALCARLIEQSGIQFIPHINVQSLDYESGQWHIAGHAAAVVVLANGHHANQFSQTEHLSLQAIRGQMTEIHASEQSRRLKLPLCGDGHILPHHNGTHAIGATYGPVVSNKTDNEINISSINNLPAHLDISSQVSNHWEGVRATTLDHLPLIGPVADSLLFSERFESSKRDANLWVASGGDYHNGLYIAAGFGSRGVTTIPLSAEYLAGLINQDPSCIPQHLVQSISPARYLYTHRK